MIRIGLISDTHGVLRAEALAELQGVDHIVHAGDIGNEEVIAQLENLAPVTAVRGNNDTGPWAERFPEQAVLEVGGVLLYVIHDIGELNLDPHAAGYRAVVYGHSHKPNLEVRNEVLFVNPGSAGPRRFRLPVSVGRLLIKRGQITPRLMELDVPSPRRS
jgi:putative phosphoesterase